MADGGIYKETGRSTLDEFTRLRQRITKLERLNEGTAVAQNLVKSQTDDGPSGTEDVYLRLDASNDPVTGALALASALSVVGATTMASTLAVTGLTTHSEMIHINAPTVGVANLRMVNGASFDTISPDDVSLDDAVLWAVAADITASDTADILFWQTRGSPFVDVLMVGGSTPMIASTTAGPNGGRSAQIDSGRGWTQQASQWNYHTSGNGYEASYFIVHKPANPSTITRLFGNRASGGSGKNIKCPGITSSPFKVDNIGNSTVDTISDSLSLVDGWNISIVRQAAGGEWFCWNNGVDHSDGSTEQGSQARNLQAIGRDGPLTGVDGQEFAEIIIYDHKMTDAQTTLIHNYLSEKYDMGMGIATGGGGGGSAGDYIQAVTSAGVVIMKMTSDPKIALGKTTPSATLDVVGTGEFTSHLIVGGDILCSGQVSAGTLAVTGTTTLSVSVIDSVTVGTLAVTGLTTLSNTDAQALSAGTLAVGGLTTLSNTDVQVLTAVSLAVSGLTTLGDATVTGLTAATLNVTGLTTLSNTDVQALSATTLNVSGRTTLSGPTVMVDAIALKSADYIMTVTDDYILVDTSAVITLPAVSVIQPYTVKNIGAASVVTLVGASGTIDGATTVTINTQYESVRVVTDGTNWHIV